MPIYNPTPLVPRENVRQAPAKIFRCAICHRISLIPSDWTDEPICPHCLKSDTVRRVTDLAAFRMLVGCVLILVGYLLGHA